MAAQAGWGRARRRLRAPEPSATPS